MHTLQCLAGRVGGFHPRHGFVETRGANPVPDCGEPIRTLRMALAGVVQPAEIMSGDDDGHECTVLRSDIGRSLYVWWTTHPLPQQDEGSDVASPARPVCVWCPGRATVSLRWSVRPGTAAARARVM